MGSLRDEASRLQEMRAVAMDARRSSAVQSQHQRGKLTARERIDRLFDPETFVEIGVLGRPADAGDLPDEDVAGDGIVIGYGRVEGRLVACASYDFTVYGASMGSVNDSKMARIRKLALEYGYPLIFFIEGGGARVQERMGSQAAKGHDRFFDLTLMSGWAPVVAAVVGPSFAGHANLAALADYVPMLKGASLGMAGPRLVEAAVGERVTVEELGGSHVHATKTGMVDEQLDNEPEVIAHIRMFLGYLPSNAGGLPPERSHDQPLDMSDAVLDIVPEVPNRGYDMHRVLREIVDGGDLFEIKPQFARTVITAFARVNGYPIAVIASNPQVSAGMLDSPSSDKMAHFISMADAFNVPLLYMVDVPGYMVGKQSEHTGIVRHSMKPLFELGQATVPRITVLVRKAYGLAYHAMGAGEFEPDLMVAWPCAEISPMGPEGAVNIAFGKTLGDDPESQRRRLEMVEAFREAGRPFNAAAQMRLDDVIDPRETRRVIAETLERTWGRPRYSRARPPKKHGINPL